MKKKIFATSDIHGNYHALIKALQDAGFDENNDSHLLVVLGDHFDRGTESALVYEYLSRLTEKGKAITIMGNHDLMFIDYLTGKVISPFNYYRNGENETFADFLQRTAPFESWCMIDEKIEDPTYGDFARWLKIATEDIKKKYPNLLNWLENQPYYYETEHYIFTHGAIDTQAEDWHKPNCQKYNYTDWEALTWDDGSFFGSDINNTEKTVVIGHFGTDHLRDKYGLKKTYEEDFSILKRDDGRVIALDSTSIVSDKVNVLVVEDELLN